MDAPLTSGELLALDPKMLWEMALGLEEPRDIALRWGISGEKFDQIEKSSWFQHQIDGIRADMERSGQNFRTKAGVMSQKLMDMIFSEAVVGETDIKNRLEVLKTLAKYADWEPKGAFTAEKGPSFSISINIPASPTPVAAPLEVKKGEKVEEIEEKQAAISLGFKKKDEEK